MQKSITGIEKSMDFQCAMLRELRSSPPRLILSDADASDVRLETSAAWPRELRVETEKGRRNNSYW